MSVTAAQFGSVETPDFGNGADQSKRPLQLRIIGLIRG
jgi:hypothetical protein